MKRNIYYFIIFSTLFLLIIVLGGYLNIEKQKKLQEKLKFKVVL